MGKNVDTKYSPFSNLAFDATNAWTKGWIVPRVDRAAGGSSVPFFAQFQYTPSGL